MIGTVVRAPVIKMSTARRRSEVLVTLEVPREFVDDYPVEVGSVFELGSAVKKRPRRKRRAKR